MKSIGPALLLVFSFCLPAFGGEPRADDLDPLVLAFYYPWYRTKDYSGAWDHWDIEGRDPDRIDGQGRREITSAHYPVGDVYDSTDPDVIRRHLEESERGGIDAWIVSWWGRKYQPGSVEAILDTIEKTNSRIKITLYYEVVPGCRGYFCDNMKPEDRIQPVLDDLEFISENYASRPAFLRVDGRPVLFIYTRTILQANRQWPEIIDRAREREDWFFSGDSITTFTHFLVRGDFDQYHFYNPVVEIKIFSARLLRYGDFVDVAHWKGGSAALTVIPGYDERNIPSRPGIYMDRKEGRAYELLWKKAIKAEADWVLITSFNEWHEGSEIEPSVEYGDEYISLTSGFSKEFKNRSR